jgi:formate hydrogenlyase subunit 6/NADH:ubiquinone oxidoreductase subunit I
MEQYIINKEGLQELVAAIIKDGKKVIAPVLRNNKPVYDSVKDYSEIINDFVQTVNSAKEVIFPRTEKLFGFRKDSDGVTVEDFNAGTVPSTVVWGIKPCDAAAIASISAIFNWDYHDKLFNTRLEKTTWISFSCQEADDNCFCTSVNGGPGNTANSDIQLTRMRNSGEFLAEILSDKGIAVKQLSPSSFKPLSEPVIKGEYLADIPVKFDYLQVSQKLEGLFESDVWKEQSLRCLGCGACAYLCPVCACFDIQDESHGKCGERLRCWDSCGFSQFTIHTSGHNPRDKQSQRWRQRLLHKFSYMPERLSVYGCTGCGRCSRSCPADINIFENLISIGR